MIRSMTGFGAAAAGDGAFSVRTEIRSVNHRHLQIKTRLPSELAHLEGEVEAQVRKVLERGAVTVGVFVERAQGTELAQIDVAAAESYKKQLVALAEKLGIEKRIELATLISLPGVIASPDEREGAEREGRLVEKSLKPALEALVRMRETEGKSLLADLRKNTQGITRIVAKIEKRMPKVVIEHHKNLKKRVDELLGGRDVVKQVDLARELALLSERMDVSEELSRLASHLDQLDGLFERDKPVGRELDFLVQEFLREANTIGAKCGDAEIAHAVVELKTLIERLREQVQNVE